MFALVADDVLYLKADEATSPAFVAEGSGQFIYRAMHLTQVLSIGSGSPATQDFFRRDRAEIDGLLHQPQEQQAARS